MKQAILFQKLPDQKVRCNLCSHRCLILPGKTGLCQTRKNFQGNLSVLTYGQIIARNVDPVEKKPLFHFLPGSFAYSFSCPGCNFRCAFCQNWQISQVNSENSQELEIIPPREIVDQALLADCRSIAYTYTEPTVFLEYALDTARLAHKKGLKNIFVTNGYQTPEAIKMMKGLIDAANVDLKSFSEKFYQKVCGAKLQPVLDSLRLIHQAGIWLEITTLLIPNQNDSSKELTQIARFIKNLDANIPWHISRFFPDYKMENLPPTPKETLLKAWEIGKREGLNYVYIGNIEIEGKENTYCPKCQNLAIARKGYNIEIKGVDNKGRCLKCKENLNIII